MSRFELMTGFPRGLSQNLGELYLFSFEFLKQLFRCDPELVNKLIQLGLLTSF
jgi:hypothetical protein